MIDGKIECHITQAGTKVWSLHSAPDAIIHRADGPAIERSDGENYWYFNGRLHRADGPAVERPNGNNHWILHGVEYNCLEWLLKVYELNK